MGIRKPAVVAIIAGVCICSCNLRPLDTDRADSQYEFAAVCLDAFFIFRDRLPSDFYAFSTPQELYESVNEKWTVFMGPDEARWFAAQLTTTHEGGIGIRIDSVASGYLIKEVFPGSPGATAGLQAFDTIIRVDDLPVAGLSWEKFTGALSGSLGSEAVLRIRRADNQLKITVIRGVFTSPSVFVDSVDTATAMIILTGFFDETIMEGGSAAEFSKALDSTDWAKNTIIDLRQNGGGMVDQSRSIISELVPAGTPIVRVHMRDYDPETDSVFEADSTYYASGRGKASQRELFLLVDRYTASASEIMVSCLMARNKVTVVGERTYGKGRGQVVLWGPDSVLAKITCMTLTPADTNAPSYDTIGIDPDVFSDTLDAFDVALGLIDGSAGAAKRRALVAASRPGRSETSLYRQPAAIIEIRGWHEHD